MKYILAIAVGMLLVVAGTNLLAAQQNDNSCFENINNTTFKQKMKDKQTVVLDVRTAGEVSQGKIGDAINIDVNQANFQQQIEGLDKSKTYLVYCHSGMRSLKASRILCKEGFKQVFNLKNGYMGYK